MTSPEVTQQDAGPREKAVSSVPMLDVGRQNSPIRGKIIEAITQICDSGQFIHGPDCARLESQMADYCQTSHAIGCASGSDALLLALMAFGIGPGDEVILPSFTFFATAGAVWRTGAKPVFADIDPATFNMDPAHAERQITSATKAVIPVHLFGACAAMDAICEFARARKIAVIEDAAQAIGAEHRGRRAGSIGDIGCFSFYPSKNLGGFGDGGMLTTRDEQIADRLRILRDHGQKPRYHHALVGINSRLDSIQAAVLSIKLAHVERWAAARGKHAARYAERFAAAGLDQAMGLPQQPPANRHVWNQYTIRVPDSRRDALQQHLNQARVGSAVYYPIPLHLQACFRSLGYEPGSLPATERAAAEVLSLPVFPELTAAEHGRVVDVIADFFATQAGAGSNCNANAA